MKRIFVSLMAASALYSGVSTAGDGSFDDRIYGGIMVNYIEPENSDANRQINISRDGVRVVLGKQITAHWGLEGFASYNEFGQYGPVDVHYKEGSVGINALYYPMERCPGIFKPFVLGGAGMAIYNSDYDSDAFVQAGIGAFWKLNDRGISIRTDASLRYLTSDGTIASTGDGPIEGVLGAGITVPFGRAPSFADCPVWEGTASVDDVMALPEQGRKKAPAEATAPATPAAPATTDSDGDGVDDANDRCPGTPAGAKVDVNGCPVPETVVIYFAFDSAELNAAAKGALDRVATSLSDKTFVVAIANGHADHTGTEEYNMGLSQRRADSVANYLISKGVAASQIRTRAYGESRPAADNSTALGRAKNRRVEINLLRQ